MQRLLSLYTTLAFIQFKISALTQKILCVKKEQAIEKYSVLIIAL